MKKTLIFAATVLVIAAFAHATVETPEEDRATYSAGLIPAMRLSCLLPDEVVAFLIASGSFSPVGVCPTEL